VHQVGSIILILGTVVSFAADGGFWGTVATLTGELALSTADWPKIGCVTVPNNSNINMSANKPRKYTINF
jgi:hypothetical protein